MNYKQSNIFIAGSSGFLGQSLVSNLEVNGYKNLFTDRVELRSYYDVYNYIQDNKIDVVFNLCAVVGGIQYNLNYPAMILDANSEMYLNIMKTCHYHDVKKVVNVGSICAYGRKASLPFKEEEIWNGQPESSNFSYGESKRLLLALGDSYHKQYGMNVINPIMTNMYGPNDHFEDDKSHVIPAIIKKIYNAKVNNLESVTFFGDGSPTREFLFVEDAADALRFLLENYDSPDPINVGSDQDVISIKDLVNKISEIIGFDGKKEWDTTKPNGQLMREVDSWKIHSLGWYKKSWLNMGLNKTIEWYIKEVENGRI